MIVAVIAHVAGRSSSHLTLSTSSTRKTSDSNSRFHSLTSPVSRLLLVCVCLIADYVGHGTEHTENSAFHPSQVGKFSTGLLGLG